MKADELLPLLDDLAAELAARDNPQWRAWTMLKPTRNGWTARLYDAGALEAWHDVLRRAPGDPSTLHHLAIMHHARAIDLEQSDHPEESDPDWRQALQYWQQLIESEKFWSVLSERVEAVPDPVPQTRQDLSERLLKMHFDIAIDEQTPPGRARFHTRLALGSGFPAELVERVRTQAYQRAVDGLDPAVWQPDSTDPQVLMPAVETVVRYLDTDEDWPAALGDLLRLLNRLQVARILEVNAMTPGTERSRALDDLVAGTRDYDRHVARLESQMRSTAEPDRLDLTELALWLGRAGQVCQASHAYGESARYYERAQAVANACASPRKDEYRREGMRSAGLNAAGEGRPDEAVEHLRQARNLADPDGAADFDKDLAQCLYDAAGEAVNSGMKAGSTAFLARGAADKAVAMLEEAIGLNPRPEITKLLESIQKLRHSQGYYW